MSAEPCPACKGRRLKPEALAVRVGGRADRRGRLGAITDAIAFFEDLALTPREREIAGKILKEIRDRLALPRQRRHRLPHLSPQRGVALGRRVAAHPPRDADRLEAHGRPLRARRAVDRPAPARQPEAHRHAPVDARSRQHRDRRRARRGDDPVRRLRRSTSGPGPASTAATSSPRARPRSSTGFPGSLTAKYLRGRACDPDSRAPPAPAPARASSSAARARTTSRTSTCDSRSAS